MAHLPGRGRLAGRVKLYNHTLVEFRRVLQPSLLNTAGIRLGAFDTFYSVIRTEQANTREWFLSIGSEFVTPPPPEEAKEKDPEPAV